ncbi:hypothetical protein NKJ01_24020 [Mesorhizobium sp. M0276]
MGSANNNGPFGIPSMLPLSIGTPNNGGPLVPAGGLTFIAASTDNKLRALDIKTGRQVWQADLPTGGQTMPMTMKSTSSNTSSSRQEGIISWRRRSAMKSSPMGLASLQSSSARMIWLLGTGGFQTVRAAQANALCPRP